jgi:hypothetical protein
MDEAEQFELFARQHRWLFSPERLKTTGQGRKQSMNIPYLFDMCSATF